MNYDRFLEKVAIHVVNELKNRNSLVEVIINLNAVIVEIFQKENNPEELSDENKNLRWMSKCARKKQRSM